MKRFLSAAPAVIALTIWISGAYAQSATSPSSNTPAPPGTKVSPLAAPDASTERGQGNTQPTPPPSPSTYNETTTQSGSSTVPGSPVSPVPAPDASTAPGQNRTNTDMAIGPHESGGMTDRNVGGQK